MSPSPLRIAAVQFRAEPVDIAGNAREHARWIAQAAGSGATVVLFPELSVSGYEPDLIDLHRIAISIDDPQLEPIREACREHRVHALVGAPIADQPGDLPKICVLQVDPAGSIRVVYAKKHLHPDETGIFAAGSTDAVLDIGGHGLGLAVCYDAAFPEHAAALASQGAEAFLLSALFTLGAEQRLENQVHSAAAAGLWVLLAQYTGPTGDGPACGGSGAWAPDGREMSRLGTEPGIVLLDLV